MEQSNSIGTGSIVFGVLAGFFALVVVAAGLGKVIVGHQRPQMAAPAAVKAPESPTKSNQPANPASPQTAPQKPPQSAPVNPSPNTPPAKPAP